MIGTGEAVQTPFPGGPFAPGRHFVERRLQGRAGRAVRTAQILPFGAKTAIRCPVLSGAVLIRIKRTAWHCQRKIDRHLKTQPCLLILEPLRGLEPFISKTIASFLCGYISKISSRVPGPADTSAPLILACQFPLKAGFSPELLEKMDSLNPCSNCNTKSHAGSIAKISEIAFPVRVLRPLTRAFSTQL